MKYKTFVIMATMGLLLLLIGCATQPATEPETIIVTNEVEVPVEKSIVIYNSYQTDPESLAVEKHLVSLYEEQNPGVDVVQNTMVGFAF